MCGTSNIAHWCADIAVACKECSLFTLVSVVAWNSFWRVALKVKIIACNFIDYNPFTPLAGREGADGIGLSDDMHEIFIL